MSLEDTMKQAQAEHGSGNTDFFQFEKSGTYRLRLLTDVTAMATHFFGKGVKPSVCYGYEKGCPYHGEIPNVAPDAKEKEYKAPSVKFQAYVLDRSDDKVKLAELPWSVVSAISDLQKDEEYAFDGYPMPYDIKIVVDKENKDPKAIYKLIAGRAATELTSKNMDDLADRFSSMTPKDYVEKRKAKQLDKDKEEGKWLSPEVIAERKEEFRKKALANQPPAPAGEDKIEYPTEDINPDDIPF